MRNAEHELALSCGSMPATLPLALPELERSIQDMVYQCLLFGLHVADEPIRTAPQVFGRVRDHVEHYVKLGIVAAASRLNARIPKINGLPVELLSDIFRRLSPDAVRLSHVCRHWRHIALADPFLWTEVSLGPGTSSWPSAVAEILSRSKHLLVTVAVRMPGWPQFRLDVARILAKHMQHVHSLHLTLPAPDALDSLPVIFGQPAPFVSTLSLSFDRSMRETLDLNPTLLAHSWPALRTVSLFRIRPPAQPSALFATPQNVNVHLSDMTGLDIQNAYNAFPSLRVLHTACVRYHNITTAISAPVDRGREQLLGLYLDIPSSDLSTLLPRLPCKSIRRIELQWNQQSTAWLLSPEALDEPVESVAVLPQTGMPQDTSWIVVVRTRSQVRLVRSVPAAYALFVVRDMPAPEVTMPVEFFARTRVQRELRKLTLLLGWVATTAYNRSLDPMLVPRTSRDEPAVQALTFSASIPEEYKDCVRDGLFSDSKARAVTVHLDALKAFFEAALPSAKFATSAFSTAGLVTVLDD